MRVPQIKILVVEQHPDYCSYVALLLQNELGLRVKVEAARNAIDALSLIGSFKPEIVVVGMNSTDFQADVFIQSLRKRNPQIDIVAITHDSLIDAVSAGASVVFKIKDVNPKLPEYIAGQNWGHVIARRLRYFGFPIANVV